MDNIGRLVAVVEGAYRAAEEAQHPNNIGAVTGVMQGADTVCIKGKNYHAIPAAGIRGLPGERLCCQLADSHRAVIIGGS